MPSGTKSFTRIFRAFFPAVIFAGCLTTASAAPPYQHSCAGPGGPSNFDYLVLASMADSPHLLAMAGYRSAAEQRSEPRLRPADYSPRHADYL
jgi:hypothetical protein